MAELKTGSILIQSGTITSGSWGVEAEPYSRGWELIKAGDGDAVDRVLRKTGWSFFFLAATLQTIVLGHSGQRTLARAMKRILAKVGSLKFNCLEVTGISTKRFLGIPYVQVLAHSRHIQKGPVLQGLQERSRAGKATAWALD
jgi:hypothetical protein